MRSFSTLFLASSVSATCQTGEFCVTSCNNNQAEHNNNQAAMTISVDKDYMDSHHPLLSASEGFTLIGNEYAKTLQATDAALDLIMSDPDYIFLEYELDTAQVDVAGTSDIYFAGRKTTFRCKYPRAVSVGGNYTVTDDPDPSPYEETGFLQYDFTSTVANGRTEVVIAKQHGIPGLQANIQNCAVTYANLPDEVVYPLRLQATWGDTELCKDNRIDTTYTYANGGATVDWRTFHFNDPAGTATSQQQDIACDIHVSQTLTVSAPSNCSCHDQMSCRRTAIPDGQCTFDSPPPNRELDGLTPTDGYPGWAYLNQSSMTIQMCIDYCKARNFAYAGLQYAYNCFCGNNYPSQVVAPTECARACPGNSTQICGDSYRTNVYHVELN